MTWTLTENEAGALVACADRVVAPYRQTRRAFMELDGETVPISVPSYRPDTPDEIRELGRVVDIILDRGAVAGGRRG